MHRSPILGVALALAFVAQPALAFERQWHLGGSLGAAIWADGGVPAGPALGAHGAYGLSDTFDLKLEVLASSHSRGSEALTWFGASTGLAYKLDVLRWVPYAGVQVGYYSLSGSLRPDPLSGGEPGMSIDLGLDYAFSRRFGLGLELRYHGFLGDPLASLGAAPLLTGLLRAEYRWGW